MSLESKKTMPRPSDSISVESCPCSICGRSLQYGGITINYHSEGVTVALSCSTCNPLRILTCNEYNCSVLAMNLNLVTSSMSLLGCFSQFGKVLSCKILEENGNSVGLGFVQFDSPESAVAARIALNQMYLEGNKLCILAFVENMEKLGHRYMAEEMEEMSSISGESLSSEELSNWSDGDEDIVAEPGRAPTGSHTTRFGPLWTLSDNQLEKAAGQVLANLLIVLGINSFYQALVAFICNG